MDTPSDKLSLISWNIKGLGAVSKQRDLAHIIEHELPDDCVIALQETHTDDTGAQVLRQRWPSSVWTTASSASAGVGFIVKSKTGRISLDKVLLVDPNGRRVDIAIRSPIGLLRLSSVYTPTNTAAQKSFFKDEITTDIDDVDAFLGD
jgi:exonuclease III